MSKFSEAPLTTDVVLIYPYFRPSRDRSPFRFPPLGLGYIASVLRNHGYTVRLVDCTFSSEGRVAQAVRNLSPSVIGIYSMFSMRDSAIRLAELLREDCDMLISGGPLPTLYPDEYLTAFDVVCIGEGEETMLELLQARKRGLRLSTVKGICISPRLAVNASDERGVRTPPRPPVEDLDRIPFPARDLYDNAAYQEYFQRKFGRKETSIITTRGCPFDCDFCSRPIFANTFRYRSAENVVDELSEIPALGYDSAWFSDDCFTLIPKRVLEICKGIRDQGLDLRWECLSRVDNFSLEMATAMKSAGCERVFFGIESGDDTILRQMKKKATVDDARKAIQAAVRAGLKAAGFFIIGYPGEDNSTMLRTIRLATQLPLDYVSFNLPYPIPGTALYDKLEDKLRNQEWRYSPWRLIDHSLLYESEFSELKLKFAIAKGSIQHRIMKHVGKPGYAIIGKPFEVATDLVFARLD